MSFCNVLTYQRVNRQLIPTKWANDHCSTPPQLRTPSISYRLFDLKDPVSGIVCPWGLIINLITCWVSRCLSCLYFFIGIQIFSTRPSRPVTLTPSKEIRVFSEGFWSGVRTGMLHLLSVVICSMWFMYIHHIWPFKKVIDPWRRPKITSIHGRQKDTSHCIMDVFLKSWWTTKMLFRCAVASL